MKYDQIRINVLTKGLRLMENRHLPILHKTRICCDLLTINLQVSLHCKFKTRPSGSDVEVAAVCFADVLPNLIR